MEERIKQLMKTLDLTREEAIQVIQDDDDIDHDKPKDFDLTEEQKKVAQSYAKSKSHKKTDNPQKRERKPNDTKRAIIQAIFEFLNENEELLTENVEISNQEKMILFKIGEENFSLDLVQKRKPKK